MNLPEKSSRKARAAIKLLAAAAAVFGVAVELLRGKTPVGALNMLTYFTIESNIIVAAVCLSAVFSRRTESPFLAAARGGATLWITVTCLVYHFLLSGHYHPKGIYLASTILLHYVTAIAMILDWLLFERKGSMRKRYAFYWLSYPFLYLAFSEARGALGGPYPYWFLNPGAAYPKGAGSPLTVALIVLGLFALFGLLGLGMAAADKAMGKG